jgi:hypothetical protein
MTTPNNNSNRELRDDELDAITGGLVIVTPQNVTLLGPALLVPSQPRVWVGCAWVPQRP